MKRNIISIRDPPFCDDVLFHLKPDKLEQTLLPKYPLSPLTLILLLLYYYSVPCRDKPIVILMNVSFGKKLQDFF